MNPERLVWRGTKGWVARSVRVTLATGCVMTAFGLVAVRVSYARATQAGMDFGDQLRQLGDHHLSGDLNGDAYEVLLNGQVINSSSADTSRPVHEVLAYFQAQCNEDAVGLGDKLAHLGPTVSTLSSQAGIPGFMTIRREQEDAGFVFCMATDHELVGPEQLDRIKAAASGDLGKIGDIRYVSVRVQGDHTNVVAAWTRGKFDVAAMFPQNRDSPGDDFANVPRPEGSRRILSGTVTGAPFGVNAYEVPGEPDAVMASVDAKLQAAGFKPTSMPDETAKASHFYSLGDVLDIGVNAIATSGGKTNVSYMVSRGVNTVTR